jgi:hypothetical protein
MDTNKARIQCNRDRDRYRNRRAAEARAAKLPVFRFKIQDSRFKTTEHRSWEGGEAAGQAGEESEPRKERKGTESLGLLIRVLWVSKKVFLFFRGSYPRFPPQAGTNAGVRKGGNTRIFKFQVSEFRAAKTASERYGCRSSIFSCPGKAALRRGRSLWWFHSMNCSLCSVQEERMRLLQA